LETIKRDWKDNAISEKSLRCVDASFFKDEALGHNVRHGAYAFSSTEWDQFKSTVEEEGK
jgi:hypothetical protein